MGEKCTVKAVKTANKQILQLKINKNGKISSVFKDVIVGFVKLFKENNWTSINIAGNGIYTLSQHNITQIRVDEIVFNLIKYLIDNGCDVKVIRSGGQTGVDESGLKTGEKLGLKTICLAPKGWRFRGVNGKDISDEKLFKKRFE